MSFTRRDILKSIFGVFTISHIVSPAKPFGAKELARALEQPLRRPHYLKEEMEKIFLTTEQSML